MSKTGSCCPPQKTENHDGHDHGSRKIDWFFWICLLIVAAGYAGYLLSGESHAHDSPWARFAASSFELVNTMWWGVAIGVVLFGVLGFVPREFIMKILGTGTGLKGVLRATLAGVLLDLCSHGILMVGARLYERGASAGQLMAFLIASPWNSLSLTLILWSLVGFKWMISFLLLSMVIGVVSGVIFEMLVKKGVLPENPNKSDLPADFRFWPEAKRQLKNVKFGFETLRAVVWKGLTEGRMVLRWIFLGVIIAGLARAFMTAETFQNFFGPTVAGLALTILVSTIIEVCSEGTTPIAADILNRAAAPGNAFAFLMAGVSTDYTEILVIRDVTKSWRIALFLPLVTLPQIALLGWVMNGL